MHRLFWLLALAAALVLLPAPGAAQGAGADSVYLRPGDVIRLNVWRQPEFSGDFPVGSDGSVLHPLLADVNVLGASRPVIRDRIRAALSRYERDPAFVFDFLYRVSVGGEVRQAGLFTLPPQTTVSQAIAAAGGTTENGRTDAVRLLRGGREIIVNLKDPGPQSTELAIQSGDQIRVHRRTNVLREYVWPTATMVGAVAALYTALAANR
jgi:protein involved in polysaccharide export with SLBB domain